jgi:hypothetical protein
VAQLGILTLTHRRSGVYRVYSSGPAGLCRLGLVECGEERNNEGGCQSPEGTLQGPGPQDCIVRSFFPSLRPLSDLLAVLTGACPGGPGHTGIFGPSAGPMCSRNGTWWGDVWDHATESAGSVGVGVWLAACCKDFLSEIRAAGLPQGSASLLTSGASGRRGSEGLRADPIGASCPGLEQEAFGNLADSGVSWCGAACGKR